MTATRARDAYLRELQAQLGAMPLPVVEPPRANADISATVVDVTMTPHERAKVANAALTTEQRSAAGKARAAKLHSITSYAQRVADRWPTATDDERREVRRRLRAAGVIS